VCGVLQNHKNPAEATGDLSRRDDLTPIIGTTLIVTCGGKVTAKQLVAGKTIDLEGFLPVLDEISEPHLRRLLKSLEEDERPVAAGFNSSI
jgi:hypothetical protein